MYPTLLLFGFFIFATPLLAADEADVPQARDYFGKPDKDGFRAVFDGKTLAAWRCVDMSYW